VGEENGVGIRTGFGVRPQRIKIPAGRERAILIECQREEIETLNDPHALPP
jgi:hypothetical protein